MVLLGIPWSHDKIHSYIHAYAFRTDQSDAAGCTLCAHQPWTNPLDTFGKNIIIRSSFLL